MSAHPLRPAEAGELRWLWPAVRAAHLFSASEELYRYWSEAPWRVQVSEKREAAVLGRWREHMGVLAIRGLWCNERRIGPIVDTLRTVAAAHGFTSLLSPLVPEEIAGPYEAAGMREVERIVALRLDAPALVEEVAPPIGVRLRLGSIADLSAVSEVDRQAFPEFWRYDPAILSRYIEQERLGLAVNDAQVIGYTLCTANGHEGTIGRLAVDPSWQGRGVGALLLRDALAYLGRSGARSVTLSTQADNAVSRRLYARTGFRELAGRLLFLLTEDLSHE